MGLMNETEGLSLVMPMAGRGSRFARAGVALPKPLVELEGRPFFWWATESVRRATPVAEMVFVVLDEHCATHAIDRRVAEAYPEARIVRIGDVTRGAAETALLGVAALRGHGPVAVNDCDHAFLCPDLAAAMASMRASTSGAITCFRSSDPAYSYATLGASGEVTGTVEKAVVSDRAIGGCYLFSSPGSFMEAYGCGPEGYAEGCPYPELFVSGLYNRMVARGRRVASVDLERHVSFGTPEEFSRAAASGVADSLGWA